jgi:hypothetical protein
MYIYMTYGRDRDEASTLSVNAKEENRYFGLCDMKKSLFRPNLKVFKYF